MTSRFAISIDKVFLTTTKLPLTLLALTLGGCMGYVPGQQSYWDAQVRERCEKDGGVTVYERVKINKTDFQILLRQSLPTESSRMDQPYFWIRSETKIHDSNPTVVRSETFIKRRSDGRVLGRSVRYSRRGGDIPTGFSEATSFACPQQADLSEKVFLVGEDSK